MRIILIIAVIINMTGQKLKYGGFSQTITEKYMKYCITNENNEVFPIISSFDSI
jgi:hypothetical protein